MGGTCGRPGQAAGGVPGEDLAVAVCEGGAVGSAGIARQAQRRSSLAVLLRRRAPHRAEARLQGHYRSHRGARPRRQPTPLRSGGCGHDDKPQARLFLCANPDCRTQVIICRGCDRGHVYCAACAPRARRHSLQRAGRRYQASRRGRFNHAARSRRYRARQDRVGENNVTHHGSPPDRTGALLIADPVVVGEQPLPVDSRQPSPRQDWCCMHCGRRCSAYLRQGFLPRRVRRNRRRGPDHDHSG